MDNKDTRFWIHPDDFNKVIAYAQSAHTQFKSEIGGQLIVIQDKEGDYILKDPVILKQEVSAGECTLDATELSKYYSKHGRGAKHCWWHSHHTMAAFWSGTDNNTILKSTTNDFSISLVVNLKREYKLRIQLFKPFLHEENVTLNFLTVETENQKEIDTEVKKLCTKPAPVITSGWEHNKHISHIPCNTYPQRSLDFNNGAFDYKGQAKSNITDVLPYGKKLEILDKIESLHDELTEETYAAQEINYPNYCKKVKKISKLLKPWGLTMTLFPAEELISVCYRIWPEDFIAKIGEKNNVH